MLLCIFNYIKILISAHQTIVQGNLRVNKNSRKSDISFELHQNLNAYHSMSKRGEYLDLACSEIFLKDFIYLFLERQERREKERERNISVWLPLTHPLLGTCAAA